MARKILLADDSVTAQNMGRKILTDAGYEVIAVNNGSAALKKIAELKPELAILDVYMPGYSGLEVCQRLKESPDGAHIPVLLSVGKLEPFKPEEAHRVRAEGYIVKPFEASELLSALAKLEDKIVPRAEASKQGRFARAIAAVEEANKAAEAPIAADGWQSRIGTPQPKNDTEEKVADEASIYNNVNRDLRTVVETPAEKLAAQQEQRLEVAKADEASVDVGAVAPEGLPSDVTPQEIAAIAAAAAQIKMAAAIEEEYRSAEAESSETVVSEMASVAAPGVALEAVPEPAPEEATQSEPATMAGVVEPNVAAISGESRWTAVSVALDTEEASVSLEQEMQKAYASSSAEAPEAVTATEWRPDLSEDVTAHAEVGGTQVVSKVEPALAEPVIPNAETAVTPISQAEPLSQIDSIAADSAAAEASSVPEAISLPSIETASEITAPITPEVAPQEVVSAVAEVPEVRPESSPRAEFVERTEEVPASDSGYFAIHAPAHQDEPTPPTAAVVTEPAMAEPVNAASGAFATIIRDVEPATAHELDRESVKTSAAAWASWRQIRDAGQSGEAVAAQSPQVAGLGAEVVQPRQEEHSAPAEPEPLPENAMAVAAGAEQISQEASSAPTNGNTSDLASIVDSLLADLRPKLMEEVARKMAQKK